MEQPARWVETWGMAHTSLIMMSFRSQQRTFRLVIHSAIAGEKARIRLCNKYSPNAVEIGHANIALCDAQGRISDPKSVCPLTFNGGKSHTLGAGATVISDAADFEVPADAYLCVNVYMKSGKLRSGNLLNNAGFLHAKGDHAAAPLFAHQKRPMDSVFDFAGRLLGMTLQMPVPLFQSLELLNSGGASSIVLFGDSLTQQGFWSSIFERQIRSLYPGRYSVINKGINGNRVLRDAGNRLPLKGFFGTKALERVWDDVLAFDGISFVNFCLGTNDFLQPGTIAAPKSETATAREIAAGIEKIAAMIRERGITLLGMNFVPIGSCKDTTPQKNKLRAEMNEWFDASNDFDHKFDIYSAFVSSEDSDCPVPSYVGKDKTHPNELGGEAMTAAVDYAVFAENVK